MALSPETAVTGIVGLGVAIERVTSIRASRKRDTSEDQRHETIARIETKIDVVQTTTNASLAEVRSGIAELRAFVVGPDGENGIRGDLREVKQRVFGLEDRERDHLTTRALQPGHVGQFFPPAAGGQER